MIISKTPLRMSFVGGGSDLPAFYRKFGGAVLSTSIDKYVFITLNRKFDSGIRVSYSRTEEVDSIDKLEHPLVRAALRKLKIDGGVEITSIADIPSKGTGLGSSSSFTVGLLHALHAYTRRYVSAEELGQEACEIEIEHCGEPIGKQDQYAAAFGGLNLIQFHPDDSVSVDPIICRRETRDQLESNCLVFFTGITRSASALLGQQSREIESAREKQDVLREMVRLTHQLKREIEQNNLIAFGELLHENWMLKKRLTSGITSPQIETWYDRARAAGAIGGKILGAGTGGFLLFYVPPAAHEAVTAALGDLRRCTFRFENAGSKIIFYHT